MTWIGTEPDLPAVLLNSHSGNNIDTTNICIGCQKKTFKEF